MESGAFVLYATALALVQSVAAGGVVAFVAVTVGAVLLARPEAKPTRAVARAAGDAAAA